MALRLRKDVQKASYYVWFLGAEEARGLRGARVLLPAIPRLIERAREQEPLKVTLQVSHKGVKIVQGSSKHFITHSAITCSVQADDIVACVLLLYNPTTKCPLHVHAYRCDSETTAQALHQFLQVLINRPDNQKRFAELEARLGLQATTTRSTTQSKPPPVPQQQTAQKQRTETSPKRFESSLGSDTGTSTRESECSEELNPIASPTTPTSPIKASLYDSLAAELRAKLNGNGPPLLLPPRDYDTVHRSKGNLTAIELRRCRNSLIVGAPGNNKKLDTSRSRGSSGIGSDLAPSPEQHDDHSSSDDEWTNMEKTIHPPVKTPRRPQPTRTFSKEKSFKSLEDKNQQPLSYLYPRETTKMQNKKTEVTKQRSGGIHGDDDQNQSYHSKEEEIKPIITRPKNFDFRFRDILDDQKHIENDKIKSRNNDRYRDTTPVKELKSTERAYRQNSDERQRDDNDHLSKEKQRFLNNERKSYSKERSIEKHEKENQISRENLTDRQKYKESLLERQKFTHNRNTEREYYIPEPMPRETFEKKKLSAKSKYKYENCREKISAQNDGMLQEQRIDYRHSDKDHTPNNYTDQSSYMDYEKSIERNPYKEPCSLPYRESIEKMMKSPIMKYKSFDSCSFNDSIPDDDHPSHSYNSHKIREPSRGRLCDPIKSSLDAKQTTKYDHSEQPPMISRRRIIEKQRSISPPETIMRVSPKDRFQGAKEKFQAMERDNLNATTATAAIINEPTKLKQSYRHSAVPVANISTRNELLRRESFENSPPQHRHHNVQNHPNDRRDNCEWSSDDDVDDDDQPPPPPRNAGGKSVAVLRSGPISSGYRDISQRYSSSIDNQTRIISPAKSLGNLVKGYRHSYAEPRNPLPRNSGRVGLAAVNPF